MSAFQMSFAVMINRRSLAARTRLLLFDCKSNPESPGTRACRLQFLGSGIWEARHGWDQESCRESTPFQTLAQTISGHTVCETGDGPRTLLSSPPRQRRQGLAEKETKGDKSRYFSALILCNGSLYDFSASLVDSFVSRRISLIFRESTARRSCCLFVFLALCASAAPEFS